MELKKYKILIVDDEETILELISDYLTQEGFSVETTTDPLDALEKVENGKVKIILTDIKMPKMDGITLLENIKKINGLVQVIIMTGYACLDNTVKCLEEGANDYLIKPFKNLAEVKEIVTLTVNKLNRWEKVVKDIYTR